MIVYTEYDTPRVRLYNRFVRENRLLRRLLFRRYSGYQRTKTIHQQMVPYCTVREGDTVIQVGATGLHYLGISQPLIYSSLVGPRGRVFVLEPDPVGLHGLIKYINVQGVYNVNVIDKAAWDRKGTEKFTFFTGHPGTNVQSDYNRHNDANPSRTRQVLMHERDTEVDTLDNIVREHGIGEVNHVNITVNGTEHRVLQGLRETLGSLRSVSFVYQNGFTAESPILAFLESSGLNVLIKHAPVHVEQEQFLVGMAAPNIGELLPEMVERGYPARFEYLPESRRVEVIRV